MIIDNKGRLFGKVSVIDILIVVVILGAIAGTAYKFSKSGATGPLAKPDKILITVFCPETPDFSVTEENIAVGSLLRDPTQGITLGTIKEVKVEDSVGYAATSDGKFNLSSKDRIKSVYVTAEGYGRYSSNGVIINNVEYSVGQILDRVKAGKSEFRYNSRVADLKKVE
ncbi:MAG: DUF4330 domain-containing protein [Clostridia bacterium]|nr:DUF4330 domain-containing protein [Clostridia bacterium]